MKTTVALFFALLIASAPAFGSAIVTISLSGSTNDFDIDLTVSDSSVAVTDYSNITAVTVSGLGTIDPDYYGSNNDGGNFYISFAATDAGLTINSSAYYANNTLSWDEMSTLSQNTPIAINSGEYVSFADGVNSIYAIGGSLTLSVTPVPEPATASLFLGFGTLAFILLRKRNPLSGQ